MFCTASTLPSDVMLNNSTRGTITKKMLPRMPIGIQKSLARTSCFTSVRATVNVRDQFMPEPLMT